MPVFTLTVTVYHYTYIVSLCKLQIQCPSLYSTNYESVFTFTTTTVSLVFICCKYSVSLYPLLVSVFVRY
jgi:hypothetical protein